MLWKLFFNNAQHVSGRNVRLIPILKDKEAPQLKRKVLLARQIFVDQITNPYWIEQMALSQPVGSQSFPQL